MSTDTRYEGKPLLRLLDLYVLKAVGELSQESEDSLNAMATDGGMTPSPRLFTCPTRCRRQFEICGQGT